MGKVSKAVRQKKKDFAKTKLKVGKSKQAPANHTDTSFRSRAVVIPKQSIHRDTAVKNTQTSQHYISLLSHKSGDVRKDALQKITSYLGPNVELDSTIMTPLMAATTPLILDDFSSVRRLLLELFDKVLDNLPRTTLNAYAKNLLLYVASAMTHISAPIRADSTKFLSWTVQHTDIIDEIISLELSRFMDSFASLLGWTSSTPRSISSTALVQHFRMLNTVVGTALSPPRPEPIPPNEYVVPMAPDIDIFLEHRLTKSSLQTPETIKLFPKEWPPLFDDRSAFDIIDRHLPAIFTFMGNRFLESIDGERSFCIPVLELCNTMLRSNEVKEHRRKELKTLVKVLAKGIERIREISNGRGAEQDFLRNLSTNWQSIQDEIA